MLKQGSKLSLGEVGVHHGERQLMGDKFPTITCTSEGWGVNLPSQMQPELYQPNKKCNGLLAGSEPFCMVTSGESPFDPVETPLHLWGLYYSCYITEH